MFDTCRMAFFTDLDRHFTVLRDVVGAEVEAVGLPSRVVNVCNADVKAILTETTVLIGALEALRMTAAGVASARSRRERGHGGMVQGEGHNTAVSFVQDLTGSTRGEAIRQVKLGEALLDGVGREDADGGDADGGTDAGGTDAGAGTDAGGEPGAGAEAGAEAGVDEVPTEPSHSPLPGGEPLRPGREQRTLTPRNASPSPSAMAGACIPLMRDSV